MDAPCLSTELNTEELTALQIAARTSRSRVREVFRARIVLVASEGVENRDIAVAKYWKNRRRRLTSSSSGCRWVPSRIGDKDRRFDSTRLRTYAACPMESRISWHVSTSPQASRSNGYADGPSTRRRRSIHATVLETTSSSPPRISLSRSVRPSVTPISV